MKNVSAAVFLKNNSVLIAKRGNGKSLSGYWEFPGGKQEEDETIFECLEREIFEEFNVKCKANEIFFENIYRNYDYDTINLIAIFSDLLENQIELKVHEDYKWVEIDKLLKYNLVPADILIAKKLIMKKINDLRHGEKLTNVQLSSTFLVANQGGMRRSLTTNSLVIISSHISIYNDRWDDEWAGKVLYYTGMGTEGDQSCADKQNKTLRDSDSNGVLVYLFEVWYPNQYTFIGRVGLAGEPFCEIQRGRFACVFPIKVIGDKNHLIDNDEDISAAVAEYAKCHAKKSCQSCCVWKKASFNDKRW